MKLLTTFALTFLVLVLLAPSVYSCSCAPSSPRSKFESSVVVFVGEFTGFARKPGRGRRRPNLAVFKVEKQWKGQPASEVSLQFWDIPGMCGDLDLIKGKKYLIYVTKYKDELIASGDCGRSKEVRNAAEDLRYLDSVE